MGNTLQKTNNRLASAFKNNDQKVMQLVYQNIFPKFRAHALKNSGDEAEAKDVYQEAFIACWRNIKEDKLSSDSNVEGYLFTIAKNKWTDHLRSARFKKTAQGENFAQLSLVTDEADTTDQKEEQRNILREALHQLGSNCKQLLQLFYFERKSMDTISKELQIASTSARNQKYRCMEKLRTLSLQIRNNG